MQAMPLPPWVKNSAASAAMPEQKAQAASAPSRLASLPSSAKIVGLRP
jgi:hypothetical protein